jgi:hypothetical protein
MRTRSRKWVLTGLGLLAVGGFAIVPCVDYLQERADRRETEQFVRALSESAADEIPPGADGDRVYGWFKAHEMSFSTIDADAAEDHGISSAKFGGGVMGVTSQRLTSGSNTHRVYFFFDKNDRVIEHRVVTSYRED